MAGLVGVFPLLVVAVTAVLLALLFRLDRRLSRGSLNAGPREPEPARPPGLLRTPWELRAIDDQLRSTPGARSRADLVKTLNRLIATATPGRAGLLPLDATDQDLATAVDELERLLELGPLDDPVWPR